MEIHDFNSRDRRCFVLTSMTVDLILSQTQLQQLWHKHWPERTSSAEPKQLAYQRYESLFLSLCRDSRIHQLAARLQSLSPETYSHSLDVFLLGSVLSDHLQMETDELAAGFLLHDVGKICIPSSILQKPGALTREEWEVVQDHPMQGYHLLQAHGLTEPLTHLALYHHEREDQTGYPFGLAAGELPASLRLLSVIDVYSALTLQRSYRDAMTSGQALYHLHQYTEGLDPVYIQALTRILLPQDSDPETDRF